jgi:hypothetical protein
MDNKMVVEKFTIGNDEYWVDKNGCLNIDITFPTGSRSSQTLSKEDTHDLLNGLGAQLRNSEIMEPIWPFKKKK